VVVAGAWIVEGLAGGEQLFELETRTVLLTLKKLFPVSPVASSTPAHASFTVLPSTVLLLLVAPQLESR
jgi:hypothetical protein